MSFAEVSVSAPFTRRQTFSYSIPPGLDVSVGQAVNVPFGDKILQGIVVALTDQPAVPNVREISGIIELRPLLIPVQVALARWISNYYLTPLFSAIALMLPPGFERRILTFLLPAPESKVEARAALTVDQLEVLQTVEAEGRLIAGSIEEQYGRQRAQTIISHLVNRGLLIRQHELSPVRIKAKRISYLRLKISPGEAALISCRLSSGRAKKQGQLLGLLANGGPFISLTQIRKTASLAVVKGLIAKGYVEQFDIEVKRDPISYETIILSSPLQLNEAQQTVLGAIKASLNEARGGVFLLHGVTGSGKTEVYLQALAEVARLGRRGIVMVPEISLTPQIIERFAARFPYRVALMHSDLTLGEQFDQWQSIRNGDYDVVVGARSALFAPQPNLGLIVLDEEHEWTYKQSEQEPRYHARAVAVKMAELTGATVILGSATPSVETYYLAQRGDYQLLVLPERVTPEQGAPLPEVAVVDLKQELVTGNRSIFSRSLIQDIAIAVDRQEQVLLFLNRRGSASFVQCRKCGFVVRCRRCQVSMTYHLDEQRLICHQCNSRILVPTVCPRCLSQHIKFIGIGTQKVAEVAAEMFPQARLLRWDSDVTRQRGSHTEILERFRSHQADILIGTQMIAKGLDLPLVTLVGVVNADTSLNLPDFRAGERTFQLLSQVAGRAGRGEKGGRVIIQTYAPEHYAVRAAAKHDYRFFYEQEIAYRRELYHPPFSNLVSLVYSHTSDNRCLAEVVRMKELLLARIAEEGTPGLGIVGPAPSLVPRQRGRYRWGLILRGLNPTALISTLPFPQGWVIDVDPAGIF